MMNNMERVAAVFREKSVHFSDSGSDHSPEKAMDLSVLVQSFMEINDPERREEDMVHIKIESEGVSGDSERVNRLRNLFGSRENNNESKAKEEIQLEAEKTLQLVGAGSFNFHGFKRQLMASLRKKGFDAGLCKSKCEKFRSFPAGNHEYIDVNIDGNRFIVEVLLVREFEIARPTSHYTSLLSNFPAIFVGKLTELQQVVRLMCSAMKESIKTRDMHVPPWRRNRHMQAKWSGSYRRTINEAPISSTSGSHSQETFQEKKLVFQEKKLVFQEKKLVFPEKKLFCFKAFPATAYHCREVF